jgi:hypothetical protein
MSRFGAGFGGALGGVVGAVVGAHLDYIYPVKSSYSTEVIFTGGLIGATIGAMIGAGSCAVKQIGTAGVGELPRLSHPRFP